VEAYTAWVQEQRQESVLLMTTRQLPISERGRKRFALRLTQWFWLSLGILEGLIGLRVMLKRKSSSYRHCVNSLERAD
jgi:hypothetical protein